MDSGAACAFYSSWYRNSARLRARISGSSREFSKISSQSPARASNSIPSKPAYSFSASSGFSGAGAKKPVAAAQSYSVGETVKHKAYGTGVILSMQKMANDTMLEIAFEKVGTKKIMANYAKLEKV